MRTSKPFSTISYNSVNFLKSKLDEMITDKWIDFYAFVRHSPEDDELKEHIHLYIVPSTLLQTDYITEHLQEYDSTHPDKPLGCIACKSSKFDDWYMYGLHDKAYLASKGQARKHYYVQ